jgi:hypothetical protein
MFTRALHLSLSWARSVQSISPHPISLRSILALSTHLRLSLPCGIFPSAFPQISYMHSSSPHSCYIPYPSHPPWLDRSNYTWRRVQVMKLLIMQFSPPPSPEDGNRSSFRNVVFFGIQDDGKGPEKFCEFCTIRRPKRGSWRKSSEIR